MNAGGSTDDTCASWAGLGGNPAGDLFGPCRTRPSPALRLSMLEGGADMAAKPEQWLRTDSRRPAGSDIRSE
jgi:hypothetical protein